MTGIFSSRRRTSRAPQRTAAVARAARSSSPAGGEARAAPAEATTKVIERRDETFER